MRGAAGLPVMRVAVAACLVLAGASLLLPFQPVYDPWAWLVWGREALSLELDTSGGPSWKPLPVMVTAALAPAGELAPELWLLVARTAWLLSIVLAYRLAARLTGPAGRGRLGRLVPVAAGLVAAGGLVLIQDPATPWPRQFAHGLSEPLAVACALGAVDRHLDRRHGQALLLGLAAALVRPEAWPLLAAYAACRWRAEPSRWAPPALALALVPALWFLPDLLASGSALTGGERARVEAAAGSVTGALERIGDVLALAFSLLLWPLWVAAAAGVALAVGRLRGAAASAGRRAERATVALAGGALVWIAAVCVEAVLGYAILARFLLPAGAAVCVVAGAGAGRLLMAPLGDAGSGGRAGRPRVSIRTAGAAAAALLIALALPGALTRAAEVPDHLAVADARAADQRAMEAAVRSAGGEKLLGCGRVWVGDGLLRPALAWELDAGFREVATAGGTGTATGRGGVFVLRRDAVLAATLPFAPRAERVVANRRWAVIGLDCPALARHEGP